MEYYDRAFSWRVLSGGLSILFLVGMVGRTLRLSYADLVSRDVVEADITLTCVSNEVGGKLIGNARWLGVRLDDLLEEADIDPAADQIVGRSVDGYTCGFPVAALDGRNALIAIGMTLTEHSTTSASGATGAATVASLARDWARRAPAQVAMREKDFGIWHEYTWERAWGLIEDAGFALLALGVQPGDRVSIQSEDRPEWVILDLATVAVRGITVGFYPTNPAAEVEYLLTDCGATVHLAEDQEQFDKVVAIDRSRLRDLRTILFIEPRGMTRAGIVAAANEVQVDFKDRKSVV